MLSQRLLGKDESQGLCSAASYDCSSTASPYISSAVDHKAMDRRVTMQCTLAIISSNRLKAGGVRAYFRSLCITVYSHGCFT